VLFTPAPRLSHFTLTGFYVMNDGGVIEKTTAYTGTHHSAYTTKIIKKATTT
jgi:hypothetical protein